MVFEKLKKFLNSDDGVAQEDYVEIDLGQERKPKKILVKLFTIKQFEDTNQILNSIREGYTIAVMDIKSLRQKDSVELKRAISKIKKTVEALEGSIVGFGENTIIAVPSFAHVHREEIEKAKIQ